MSMVLGIHLFGRSRGANFLVEWRSDSLVNEPLIEAVTLFVKPNNSVAILSEGKIMMEER